MFAESESNEELSLLEESGGLAISGMAMDHDDRVDFSDRLVTLTGAYNFRDIGGYPATDGLVTKWGRLYRSDGLHRLTSEDAGILRSIGLTTIVDLRTSTELDQTGRGVLADEPMSYHHLSVIQQDEGESVGAPAPAGDDLAERYLWYLDTGRTALVEGLRLVSTSTNLPLVFHCTAGKDRTGVLAALVLDILGVGNDVIVDDYLITASRLPLLLDRFRSDPNFSSRMTKLPASRFSVEATTMERFLHMLNERYGGAQSWALQAGVSPQELAQMRGDLLEPGP